MKVSTIWNSNKTCKVNVKPTLTYKQQWWSASSEILQKILQSFERTKTYRISMLVKGHFESKTLYWFRKEQLHFQRSVLRMSLWQLCWEIDALLSLCKQFDFDFLMSLYHYNFFAGVLKICETVNEAKLVVKQNLKYMTKINT